MRTSYVIVFPSLTFSLHCKGPEPTALDLPPVPTSSASGVKVKPAPRSYEFWGGKAPRASLFTDEERFRLVLGANGWGDFSRHIEGLEELHITDVRTIEIELPLSSCGFAEPTKDGRLHRCYYFEKPPNEKPAEVRFVLGDSKVVTWSDGAPGKRLFVTEGLTLVSTEEVHFTGEPSKSRYFSFSLSVTVTDETTRATGFHLPLYLNYYELP